MQQPDLAKVLESISDYGANGFYHGEVATKLIASVQKAGGIWQQQDLNDYQIVERQPITGTYKNIDIVSASLPSSGGIVLMQILNMLSNFDLQSMNDVQRKHLIVEAMRRAYYDRAQFLGDVDFVDVSVEELLSLEHAGKRFADFNIHHASNSQNYIHQEVVNTLQRLMKQRKTLHIFQSWIRKVIM